MITKEKKQDVVKELKKIFSESKSIVFANFHGLNVLEVSNIRRSLKKEGVGYKVARKTLIRRALKEIAPSGEAPSLEGELSVVDGEDVVLPARLVYEFQKKLDGKISIMGGIFDGSYRSKEEMLRMATIPSLQVLRGMFVNVINSPIQRFAIALGEIAKLKN